MATIIKITIEVDGDDIRLVVDGNPVPPTPADDFQPAAISPELPIAAIADDGRDVQKSVADRRCRMEIRQRYAAEMASFAKTGKRTLTQKELAAEYNSSVNTISHLVRGETYRQDVLPPGLREALGYNAKPRKRKMSDDEVRRLRVNREGLTDTERARKYGVSRQAVTQARTGKTYKWVK